MTTQFSIGRCHAMRYRECAQANGLTFLIVDWLPWTTKGVCRECARSSRPDLIASFEYALYSLTRIK